MGNSMLFDSYNEDFSKNLTSQWEIVSDGKCTKYVNKISNDEFVLKLIDYSKSCQIAYRARQLYSFEECPKISILQSNQTHIQILVQDATEDLTSWLSKQLISRIQVIIIFKKLLQGLLKLRKKYGCFYLTKNMIKVSKNGKILIWINENFENNYIAYKLPQGEGEETMLTKLSSFFGTLLPPIDHHKIKSITQGITLMQRYLAQKALSEIDQSYFENHSGKKSARYAKRYNNDSLNHSKGANSHKSYTILINQNIKTPNSPNSPNSPKIIHSTSKQIEKNPEDNQNVYFHRQPQPFSLKLNPISYESYSESLPSNYSQSSKKSNNQNKIFLENNLFKGRNDMLFISMGSGQNPKTQLSIADTEQDNTKHPFYQKNLEPLIISSSTPNKITNMKGACQTLSEKKSKNMQLNIEVNTDSKSNQMRESGQLPSPIRRQINSQLSKLL